MALFLEDTKKVTKKQIPIPRKAKEKFKAMKYMYKPYLNKPIQGAKILKSLASDKVYNNKNDKLNGRERDVTTVSVEDAKKRLSRQEKLSPNSLEYQLYGGQLAHDILKKGVEGARGVKSVDAVKPPKPTTNADVKPSDTSIETVNVPNGKITYTVTSEGKLIREGIEDSKFYEYLEDYGTYYVFSSFLNNKSGKQNWGVLINPNMYGKALREFTKYGKLVNFPAKYVYQWMGIIMKNTAILCSNTEIVGHSSYFPYDDFEDFANDYFNNEREVIVNENENRLMIGISVEEAYDICKGKNVLISEDNAIDKYGQTYFPWVKQSDADRFAMQSDVQRFLKTHSDFFELIDRYNENKHIHANISVNQKNGDIHWCVGISTFLYSIGLYDWMEMPDGSEAWSDYGLSPLVNIFKEYNEGLEPEKVLVLVNRALDVYHQRGDMASIFITGGSKSLSQIAESVKASKKKVYITENQIINLWQTRYRTRLTR